MAAQAVEQVAEGRGNHDAVHRGFDVVELAQQFFAPRRIDLRLEGFALEFQQQVGQRRVQRVARRY
ncbi:MAG: hypothetical protein Q8J99_16335 [Sulfuritalea sp.]|nr:hypothetical protein [Sulfuritalea sp.]